MNKVNDIQDWMLAQKDYATTEKLAYEFLNRITFSGKRLNNPIIRCSQQEVIRALDELHKAGKCRLEIKKGYNCTVRIFVFW